MAAIKHLADDLLEQDQIDIAIQPSEKDHLIAQLPGLPGGILTYRNGEPLDVDRDLQAIREERDDEFVSLR